MPSQGKKAKWQISIESVYSFGREERLQSAYEIALPTENIELNSKDETNETRKNRTICSGVE